MTRLLTFLDRLVLAGAVALGISTGFASEAAAAGVETRSTLAITYPEGSRTAVDLVGAGAPGGVLGRAEVQYKAHTRLVRFFVPPQDTSAVAARPTVSARQRRDSERIVIRGANYERAPRMSTTPGKKTPRECSARATDTRGFRW